MSNPVLEVIRDAIRQRRQLTFYYDGLYREVCPHAVGMKDGQWHLFVWQFGGSSRGGLKGENWRCMVVSHIASLTVRDGQWYRGWTKGYGPSSCIDIIDTVVDAAHAAEVLQTSTVRIR